MTMTLQSCVYYFDTELAKSGAGVMRCAPINYRWNADMTLEKHLGYFSMTCYEFRKMITLRYSSDLNISNAAWIKFDLRENLRQKIAGVNTSALRIYPTKLALIVVDKFRSTLLQISKTRAL